MTETFCKWKKEKFAVESENADRDAAVKLT